MRVLILMRMRMHYSHYNCVHTYAYTCMYAVLLIRYGILKFDSAPTGGGCIRCSRIVVIRLRLVWPASVGNRALCNGCCLAEAGFFVPRRRRPSSSAAAPPSTSEFVFKQPL